MSGERINASKTIKESIGQVDLLEEENIILRKKIAKLTLVNKKIRNSNSNVRNQYY